MAGMGGVLPGKKGEIKKNFLVLNNFLKIS
jgi:hypothetical protein